MIICTYLEHLIILFDTLIRIADYSLEIKKKKKKKKNLVFENLITKMEKKKKKRSI